MASDHDDWFNPTISCYLPADMPSRVSRTEEYDGNAQVSPFPCGPRCGQHDTCDFGLGDGTIKGDAGPSGMTGFGLPDYESNEGRNLLTDSTGPFHFPTYQATYPVTAEQQPPTEIQPPGEAHRADQQAHFQGLCGNYHMPSPMSTCSTSTITPNDAQAAGTERRVSAAPSPATVNFQTAVETICAVESICLAASKRYLEERWKNWRLRSGASLKPLSPRPSDVGSKADRPGLSTSARHNHNRWSPYHRQRQHDRGQPDVEEGARSQSTASASDVPDNQELITDTDLPSPLAPAACGANLVPTDSLLTNIGNICTSIWNQSQRDRAHVPRSERVAVENMGHLLECAESIAWARRDEWALQQREGEGVKKVLTAGRNLCSWLGDRDGWDIIEDLERGEE